MEWGGSGDGEGTDYSTTSSPPRRNIGGPALSNDIPHEDSLSDDDLSDDFSLVDSDEDDEGSQISPRQDVKLKRVRTGRWSNLKALQKKISACLSGEYLGFCKKYTSRINSKKMKLQYTMIHSTIRIYTHHYRQLRKSLVGEMKGEHCYFKQKRLRNSETCLKTHKILSDHNLRRHEITLHNLHAPIKRKTALNKKFETYDIPVTVTPDNGHFETLSPPSKHKKPANKPTCPKCQYS